VERVRCELHGGYVRTVSPAATLSGAMVTYTSAASAVNIGTVTLTATSVADNSASAAATITLTVPPAPTPSAPLNLGEASVPEGFGIPVIAADLSGNIDVAWINQPGPEFVRSTNGGNTFSAPLIIPSNMQNTASGNNIQMGVDGNGNISLLWHRVLTPTGTVPNSFFSRSTDGGATFSPEVNPGAATSAQLVVAPSGNISIIWFDQTTSNLLAVSSSDSVNFSTPTTVWTAVGSPMDLIVKSGPHGQLYLFWTQVATMTNCSILFSSSADGIAFTPTATISTNAGSCNQTPSALVDSKRGRPRRVGRGRRFHFLQPFDQWRSLVLLTGQHSDERESDVAATCSEPQRRDLYRLGDRIWPIVRPVC
jgi:hypothetical protein